MIATIYAIDAIGIVWISGIAVAILVRRRGGGHDIVNHLDRWIIKPGVVALALGLLLLVAQGLVSIARAHEAPSGFRYDSFCCSDQDCRPADIGEIVAVSGGWHIVPSNLYVAPNDHRIHDSPDGRFHICNTEAGNRKSAFWCIYIPAHGS